MYLLNLASFILGCIALILPIINLANKEKSKNSNWPTLSILSISACTTSIYLQMVYNNYLVKVKDWTALLDITNSVTYISGVLISVTLILNFITISMYKKKNLGGR
jgi:cytochrome c oxidase subunit 4